MPGHCRRTEAGPGSGGFFLSSESGPSARKSAGRLAQSRGGPPLALLRAPMRILSFLTEPPVVRKILQHLASAGHEAPRVPSSSPTAIVASSATPGSSTTPPRPGYPGSIPTRPPSAPGLPGSGRGAVGPGRRGALGRSSPHRFGLRGLSGLYPRLSGRSRNTGRIGAELVERDGRNRPTEFGERL